ncbi:MAG TPA: DUF2298 domain-containing protein [Opitutaceae bacterium]|jgi:hypothetical protein|nr:DUF2298 domain-containing protein [Opitutaceae bacterium]
MTLVLLTLVSLLIWVHLAAVALLARSVVGSYAMARIGGGLAVMLGLFCLEHFVGLGARPPVVILTAPLCLWLIWRQRAVLQEHRQVEVMFALGFFYCLAWRCAFPDIDLEAERIPDLVFIQDYMTGGKLPAMDRWLPPFDVSFYYGFQHYAAAWIARGLGVDSGVAYHLGFSVLVGLVTAAAGSAVRVICAWKPAPYLVILALLVGGNGISVGLPALLQKGPELFQSSRFLGFHVGDHEWNALGRAIGWTFNPGPDELAPEFPMDAFSYLIYIGEYHPPLFGFLLLGLSALVIATLERGSQGRERSWAFALLAATVPVALIGNVWVAPLQAILVVCVCAYRSSRREFDWVGPTLAGGLGAAGLCAPHLIAFASQPITQQSSLKLTSLAERTPIGQWVLMFWPVLLLLVLGIWSRRRPGFTLFLTVTWALLLIFADVVLYDDLLGGTWNRYNSTLKWWPWIYAGMIITLAANNLDSPSRFCRWGTVLGLITMSLYGGRLAHAFVVREKPSAFKLSGHHWITQHQVNNNVVRALASRPDGIALESGPVRENSEHSVLTLFGGKQAYLGWVAHQDVFWRDGHPEIERRRREIEAFYSNRMPDPLDWLVRRDIRYVLWLQRDNGDSNRLYRILGDKIASEYEWYGVLGEDDGWRIGFWERKVVPARRE